MSVTTRFAPSPTGYLHIGGARTALYSWLYARQQGGRFVLRIEDTDRERSTEESVQAILDGMAWLGLEADEPPVFQTARFDRYAALAQQLLDDGHAYHCYCTKDELETMREQARADGRKPMYDGRCRHRSDPVPGIDPVIRFRSPDEGETAFDDLIKQLQESLGLTVFMVTHDLDSLHAICDRIAVLAEKKVLVTGSMKDMLDVDHPWVHEYFHGPRARAAQGQG